MNLRPLRVALAVLALSQIAVAGEPQKVLLDTDIGSDIDDAFALALILASPELELVGVAVDHGRTEERARIVCRLLYEVGREEIPVAVGGPTADVVGESEPPAKYCPQFRWAEGFDRVKPIETPAADFMIHMLRKYPNEIVLITIGPVPNLGDVVRKDPEALKLAKAVYAMFGSFYMGYESSPVPAAEYNVRMDVASSKLFVACGARITYVGLDVTSFVKLDRERIWKLSLRHSPLTDALCALYSLWGHETPVLYDVVAVGMVLWPELFATRKAHVEVTDEGYTVIREDKSPNGRIATWINREEFLKRVMERYLNQNLTREW